MTRKTNPKEEKRKELEDYSMRVHKESQKKETTEYREQLKRDRKRLIKISITILIAFAIFIVTYLLVQKIGTKLVYKGEKEVEYIEIEDDELAELELDDDVKLELMKATAVTMTKNRYLSFTPEFKRKIEREYLPYISDDLIGKYFYHDSDGENRYSILENQGVYAEAVTVFPYYVGISVQNIYRDNPKEELENFTIGKEYLNITEKEKEKLKFDEELNEYIIEEESGWKIADLNEEGMRLAHKKSTLEEYYDIIGNDAENIHYTISLVSELTLREVGTNESIGSKYIDTFFGFNENGHLVYFSEGAMYD